MPIFSRGAHTFLFLNGFVIRFKITWDKKNGPFRLKSGYLTPKTLKSCFWGLKPIFSPVTPTSFFLNRFQMWFDTSFEEKNILCNFPSLTPLGPNCIDLGYCLAPDEHSWKRFGMLAESMVGLPSLPNRTEPMNACRISSRTEYSVHP